MNPDCPICLRTLDTIVRGDEKTDELICRNEVEEVEGVPHTAYSGAFAIFPQFAQCPVCYGLHKCGAAKEWWDCYLTDDGLNHLRRHYLFGSDPASFTISRLIEEVQRLRKELDSKE